MPSNRRKKQRECPNPLFLKWLELWRDEAKQKNSKLQYTYGKAATALRKYPLPLSCGKEAMILDNIGDMIARRLDEAMEKHNACNLESEVLEVDCIEEDYEDRRERDPTLASLNVPSPPKMLDLDPDVEMHAITKKKAPRRKSTREYIPAFRSGPFALMLTLYRESQKVNYRGYMTRPELQKEAQPLCDASFTVPDPGSHYTAWSSMSTLTKKGLILKTNNPARYSLTGAGIALAGKLEGVTETDSLTSIPMTTDTRLQLPPNCSDRKTTCRTYDTSSNTNIEQDEFICIEVTEPQCSDKQMTTGNSRNFTEVKKREQKGEVEKVIRIEEDDVSATPDVVLRPGTFDIVLCVDVNETSTGQAKSRKDALAPELKKNGVQFDVRKLQLGDFLWVARERTIPTPGCLSVPVPRELVLDYIVERKRMDDLCGSIIDGRFREQKFRLHHCGLKHPIYLVEDFGSIQHMSLPESTLQQAIINTQVVDGFFVKRTHDLKESVAYLTVMTRYLQRIYSNKTLLSCYQKRQEEERAFTTRQADRVYLINFPDFNDSTVKNKVMTVSEIFAKQLMQINGMSSDKAVAIIEKYPTPKRLVDAYRSLINLKERELLLSVLKCGKNQRNLGPTLSRLIHTLYSSPTLS
ncbi:crossover junction endonuclease MUS81-like isoform X1 [Acropora muricata]|uniref:crossover junction endonuclease MUS81-like isoform X1 n=2 Tax=Acropora muricata TaxID=159855 RepID=UPI0034E37FE9